MRTRSNPKNAGRNKKLTDDELVKIIEYYMQNRYEHNGCKINGSLLARFSRELNELFPDNLEFQKEKYKLARYYDFNNRPVSKEEIERIKSKRKNDLLPNGSLYFQRINIDNITKRVLNNPVELKYLLDQMQEAEYFQYTNAVKYEQKYVESNSRLKAIELELQQKEDLINDLKNSLKQTKRQNSKLSEENNMLRKTIEVDNHIAILKWVSENTFIEGDLTQQYLTTLLKCGLVREEDCKAVENGDASPLTESISNVTEIKDMMIRKEHEQQLLLNESKNTDTCINVSVNSLREKLSRSRRNLSD